MSAHLVKLHAQEAPGECATRLMDVAPLIVRFIRREMRTHMPGLTMPQFRAMGYLYRKSGSAQNRLADHLGVTPATVSSLVNRLVKRGLATRRPNPANRREVILTLTRMGTTRVEAARDAARRRIARVLSGLPASTLRAVTNNLTLLGDVFSKTQGDRLR
jgi:DNA-binding MarR family transcriptional regulator